MSFLAILISLLAERFLGSMEELRRFDAFADFSRWVRRHLPEHDLWDGAAGVVLVLAPPVAAVALVDSLLASLLLLLALIFAVVVLVYSLGPRDLEAEVEACADAMTRGDDESARWYAGDLLEREPPEEPADFTRSVVEAVFVQTNERILAVLLWFVLLGPTGAILYRLTVLLKDSTRGEESGFAAAVERLHHILAWPAARVAALGYALSGSFVGGIEHWRDRAARWDDHNDEILVTVGMGALHLPASAEAADEKSPLRSGPEPVRDALGLVRRAVLIWLTVLALMTLAGWAG